MRTGYDNGFINDPGGKVIAVNLGADHVSEHEWGIDGIKRSFGLTPEAFGVERRRVRAVPTDRERFEWFKGTAVAGKNTLKPWVGFWFSNNRYTDPPSPMFYDKDTLWTAWDEKSFAVAATDERRVREVYEAVCALDACIWLGGGGVFQNAGLGIGISSRMDKKVLDDWNKSDREFAQIKIDAAATGIEARLKAAGKGFYALSPRRDEKHGLIFWLNPYEQNCNKSGWFTVKDLDDWIAGKGPVLKGRQP